MPRGAWPAHFHAFEFDADGKCQYIPSLGKATVPPKAMQVRSYPTYEAHGLIWIFWGQAEAGLQPPAWFDIDASFSYSGYHDRWPVHYSRMVENQMDVQHLPFIHIDTIGRGNKVVVDGPLVTLENDLIRMWVFNRVDDGTPPRKAGQLPPPTRPAFLEFRFPNTWQNRISDSVRIFVAFVPIDEENGMFYMRFYQKIVRVPLLRAVFNWVGVLGSRHIANQDKRVVSGQFPKKSGLDIGEKFVQGDRVILTYRRRRQELIEQARNRAEQQRPLAALQEETSSSL